jgi:Na+/proline symporter
MATHGIDQDTVQRMLTAKNRKQSAFATIMSGVIDFPVVGAFIFIGVLLAAYYGAVPDPTLPRKVTGELETGQVFPHFILTRMPHGVCGLVVAGLLATAMGSLSTALNALGTSFATDFVFPRVGEANLTEKRRVRILRWSTALFAAFIVIVGLITAWYMAHNPKAQIIPLVLGILGFTFGSLLGVFLVAVLTKSRGNDTGNIIAMCCGFVAVLLLSNPFGMQQAMGIEKPFILAFPWRVTLGTFVTVAIALCFPTPADKVRKTAEA